jgi:hypothetical protein
MTILLYEAENNTYTGAGPENRKETTMNRFRWLVVCVAVSVGVAAGAQKIDLKVNYDPGTYVMVQDMTMDMLMDVAGQTIKTKTTMAMTAEMVVGKADKDGNREMKLTFRHMKTEVSQGGQVMMKFDSTNKGAKDPMAQMYGAMIDKTITMTVDSRGRTSNIQGFDELMGAVLANVPDGPEKENLKKNFGNQWLEGFGQMQAFPDKPVAKGDTWEMSKDFSFPMLGDAQITQVFTLKDVKDGVATLGITAEMKAEGDGEGESDANVREMNMIIDGTMLVDVATGLAKSTTMSQQGTFVMTVQGMEMSMTMDGQQKVTITKGAYKAPKAAK